jgi:hypothetical protein
MVARLGRITDLSDEVERVIYTRRKWVAFEQRRLNEIASAVLTRTA